MKEMFMPHEDDMCLIACEYRLRVKEISDFKEQACNLVKDIELAHKVYAKNGLALGIIDDALKHWKEFVGEEK